MSRAHHCITHCLLPSLISRFFLCVCFVSFHPSLVCVCCSVCLCLSVSLLFAYLCVSVCGFLCFLFNYPSIYLSISLPSLSSAIPLIDSPASPSSATSILGHAAALVKTFSLLKLFVSAVFRGWTKAPFPHVLFQKLNFSRD